MKQFFFLLAVSATPATVHAQLNKGQWLVGGSASFSYVKNNNEDASSSYYTKSTSLQISPVAAYFVINKLAVGLRPGFATSHDKYESHGIAISYSYAAFSDSKSNGLTLSPFVRYYFLPAKSRVNLLADFSYGYEHEKTRGTIIQTSVDANGMPVASSNTTENKYNYHLFTLAAGPALFINQRVSLELLVGYAISKQKAAELLQHLLTANAGFQIHLGK